MAEAHAAGLPFAPRLPAAAACARSDRPGGRWVTADSVYGADHQLRRWLRAHRPGDVLAVTGAQRHRPSTVRSAALWGAVVPAGSHRALCARRVEIGE